MPSRRISSRGTQFHGQPLIPHTSFDFPSRTVKSCFVIAKDRAETLWCHPDNGCDPDTGKRLVFLTNNVALPAETVAALYKKRWQVWLFFKWIKQNLRIKHFYGTSDNAVKTQIWIAVSVYVIVAIIKKELALEVSLMRLSRH
jgi:hypothetical protein